MSIFQVELPSRASKSNFQVELKSILDVDLYEDLKFATSRVLRSIDGSSEDRLKPHSRSSLVDRDTVV